MGLALDTVALHKANPGATGAAPTPATGDSLTIRSFASSATAQLLGLFRQGATAGFIGLKSPRMSDDVKGIQVFSAATPTPNLVSPRARQGLYSGDTLTATLSGGTAETDAAAFNVYYSTLAAIAARLHQWGDIAGLVANVLPVYVAAKSGAAGQWRDTLITTTSKLLKADTTYAVLGYEVGTATLAVGVRGQETGNLRVAGPGVTTPNITNDYFVKLSQDSGLACIPVFASNNRTAFYVSVVGTGATTTAKVTLILAQLAASVS